MERGKRLAPALTDDQINGLIERSLDTPEAEKVGLVKHPDEDYPYGQYVFVKRALDGGHDAGDFVTPDNFRSAMQFVLNVRGNLGDNRAVADAYWDMVRKPCEEWTTSSIMTLASMAPLQGVMEEAADENERKGEER